MDDGIRLNRPSSLPRRLAAALRSDMEFHGAVARLLVGVVVSAVLAIGALSERFQLSGLLYGAFFGYFFLYATVLAVDIFFRPGKVWRLYVGVLLDVATTTMAVALTGPVHSFFFPLYLWITLTNGVRFGAGPMLTAAASAILMYNGQLLAQGLWVGSQLPVLVYALFLILFPLYFMHMIRALHQARRDAESANRAKSEFLANMTHELRTPLVGVTGLAALLATTPLNREQLGYVMTLQSSARLLTRLIEDLLDLSRIEAGKLELRADIVDPGKVVAEVMEMLAQPAREKGLRLRSESRPGLVPVVADEVRFKQVLLNLVGNAVKFTHKGEVVVRAELLSRQGTTLRMRFEVEDTGVGIAADQLAQVFERFRQGDSSAARVHQGAGLGTTISKHLVEMMGGTIGVASEVGKGTRFWFELALPAANAAVGLEPIPVSPDAVHAGAILLVEDNTINAMAIGTILRKAGYRVDVAGEGHAALAAQAKGHYSLVFLDVQLPGMDGPDVARLWRAREPAPGTPIVALTANASMSDRDACLAAGMDDFVTKPVETARLLAVAAHYCRQGRPPARPGPAELNAAQ
jgi:two-component system sensor histidine kinase RpfC